MITRLIHRITRKHHHWRDAKFDELSEIYTSMTLRSFGFSIIGIFVPVYLYLNGISLRDISLFYVMFFGIRAVTSLWIGKVVGHFGPKHSIAISTIILILFLLMLLTYSTYNWPLVLLALVFTIANGLFFVAYAVDFSKIRHKSHGGKELGWLYIFERVGSAAGPFVGGLIGSFISPEATIIFALLMLLLSLIPLFMSAEPVKTRQTINFKGLDMKLLKYDFIAHAGFNMSHLSSAVYWPLFIAVFVVSENVYATLGSLVGVSMLVSMLSAHFSGKIIDSNKGFYVIRFGTIITLLSSVIRPFITTTAGALAVTTLEEPTVVSYKIALVKGTFDRADSLEGHRIAYLTLAELLASVSKGAVALVIFVLSGFIDPGSVLQYSFIFTGALVLLMNLQDFPALRRR
ncbi:MAG: MFS family permease [Candidatus Saccharimonadales bacterium]|jgi:MFS family permease